VFVWLTSAAEAEDIEDEWTDEEEWQHNMRRMAQGSKQEDSEDDVESSDEI